MASIFLSAAVVSQEDSIRARPTLLEVEHNSIVRDVLAVGDLWGGAGSDSCQEFIDQLGHNFQVIYWRGRGWWDRYADGNDCHGQGWWHDVFGSGGFMTSPSAMRAAASCFDAHAQRLEEEGRKMRTSSPDAAGSGGNEIAQAPSYYSMIEVDQAFGNIVTALRGVRASLIRCAHHYEIRWF